MESGCISEDSVFKSLIFHSSQHIYHYMGGGWVLQQGDQEKHFAIINQGVVLLKEFKKFQDGMQSENLKRFTTFTRELGVAVYEWRSVKLAKGERYQ